MQYFKGDDLEKKFYQVTEWSLDLIDSEKDAFLAESYFCYLLGEVLYDEGASTISSAIPRFVFRESFFSIFDSFINGGSFESYMIVFRAIFGDSVEVEFEVPSPGVLLINIAALEAQTEPLIGRRIIDNKYHYENILDHEGDIIMAQTTRGLKTQKDIDILMPELTPAGIYVETTLVVGGA